MKNVIAYSLLCLVFLCFLPNESATSQSPGSNLLVNGSFEEGVALPPSGWFTWIGDDDPNVDNPNSSTIAGWTVSEIDWMNGLWNASEGGLSLDMNGFWAGYVEQSFNTVVGNTYTVTFDMAGASHLPALSIRATAAGVSFDFGADPAGNSDNVRSYETKSFDFIANSTSTTLRLESLNFSSAWPNRAGGPALDNVSVEAVAENSPPDVSNPTVSPASIWPPNNKMVDISIGGVTDADGDPVTITVTEIADNEGSDPDDVVTGTSPQVRAQRDGKGSGRTYTIFFDAYDGTETVSAAVTVTVPHDQGNGKPKNGKGKPNLAKGSDFTSLPKSFTLDQNYPNPFNPSTTIRYGLTEAVSVRLTIYNSLGQPVRELVNSVQGAGRYHAVWDGRDAAGRQVSSGMYFYRLEAGANVALKKMILAK
ncbi:DUF642 domain-containing protein [candidate division KSB1 bacterium]